MNVDRLVSIGQRVRKLQEGEGYGYLTVEASPRPDSATTKEQVPAWAVDLPWLLEQVHHLRDRVMELEDLAQDDGPMADEFRAGRLQCDGCGVGIPMPVMHCENCLAAMEGEEP